MLGSQLDAASPTAFSRSSNFGVTCQSFPIPERFHCWVLHDFCDVKFPSDISYDSLSDSFKRNTQQYGGMVVNCQSAIVVGDAQSYMKIHQYLVSGRLDHSSVERKAFRDIKKAFEWLGIPEGYEIDYPTPGEAA